MTLWSDIPACAKHMFRRQDPGFHDRALDWGGGLIVGGHNYGQGSSREHAALAPLHLGIRAVVARSFARIHRANLIAQSILPLELADEAEHDAIEQGETWRIAGVRGAVEAGDDELTAETDNGRTVALRARLSARERETLLAGGLRELVRARSA
jgi:aconitate hydratase